MPTAVRMPKLGWTMEEGTILQWYKQEGEAVEQGKPLLEVETDKVAMDVESPASGILGLIKVGAQETVSVETLIAVIVDPDETVEDLEEAALSSEAQQGSNEGADATQPFPGGSASERDLPRTDRASRPATRVLASPAARRLARQHGLDLAEVKGSGPAGVASLQDVQRHLEQKSSPATTGVSGKRVPLSRLRKTIGERMQKSFQTAPHFTATVEVDMTKAEKQRESLGEQVRKEKGCRLTLTALVAHTAARVLTDHPFLNSLLEQEDILIPDDVNVGVAVALKEGLVVPVIHQAQKRGLVEIAGILEELSIRAKKQELGLSEVSGATFTISNLGMFGIDQFTAIINPPQTAILAVGRTVEKPVFSQGRVEGRVLMKMTLSADHRTVDGALVGAFLADLRKRLEDPDLLEIG